MDPENESVCCRIDAEYARTNGQLNQLFAEQQTLRGQLGAAERALADANSEHTSILSVRAQCATAMRLRQTPAGRFMNAVRLADCAERLRRADDDLRDARGQIARAEGDIRRFSRELSRVERALQNVMGIRETLDQQSRRFGCG